MKQTLKLCSLALMLSCLSPLARAQNCINGISTNPKNPKDPVFIDWVNQYPPYSGSVQHNPFLNTFDWQDPFNRIDISPLLFNIPGANPNVMYGMQHPFNGGLDSDQNEYYKSLFYDIKNHNISVNDRDFHWEDGWELLWMSLGYTPDGSAIDNQQPGSPFHGQNTTKPDPNHIPYFVLYNKYRGIMRVFASVFFNSTTTGRHQKISINLRFDDRLIVNGMLKYAGPYDRALDKETVTANIHGNSLQAADNTTWLMADFNIAYDPCICTRNSAHLNIDFHKLLSMDIKMSSISASIQHPGYIQNFANLFDGINGEQYKSGTILYNNYEDMLKQYNQELDLRASQLSEYNSFGTWVKKSAISLFISMAQSGGIGAASFLLNATGGGSKLMSALIPKENAFYSPGLILSGSKTIDDLIKDAFKNFLGDGTKSLFTSILQVPDDPGKVFPLRPMATISETSYTGKISV